MPSTSDLLNRLQDAGIPVPSRQALRTRTASFLGSLENLHALAEDNLDSPRRDMFDELPENSFE